MSLFNTIRSLFGFKAEVEESQQPIDQLDDITSQLSDKKSELVKAQREFDEINSELTLKLKACDKLIEKGVKEGEFNKNVIQQRLDKITDEFLTNIQTLSKQVSELEQQKVQVEGDILAKAIDLTSRLTKAEQQEINDIIVTWKETGLIKGQEITSHTRAIVTALDEIVKGGLGSRGGEIIGYTKSGKPIYKDKKAKEYKRFTTDDHYDAMIEHGRRAKLPDSGTYSEDRVAEYDHHSKVSSSHQKHVSFEDAKKIAKKRNDGLNKGDEDIKKSHEPLAIELAGKGDVIYDSPVEGHYANAIVCKHIKGEKYILFLKRAADKAVEPGKWCLPGGHIDEGETIEQAAARELKEEANLDSTGGYVRGKAKCDDGKWAFYVEISPDSHSLALLDGESQNATWMCREEWIEADLIFDLKDHLVAMESRSVNIKDIPDIINPDTLKKSDDDSDLEKGGFHPQKPHHKYVRREGSPGNYTYYYDSPDMKSKDGKTQREGLYSSNVAPVKKKEKPLGTEIDRLHKKIESHYGRKLEPSQISYLTGTKEISPYLERYRALRRELDKGEDDNDLEKSIDIDNPFYYDSEDDLIKGRAAAEGEERTWGGKKYRKQGGKWMPVGSGRGATKKHELNSMKKLGGGSVIGKTKSGKEIHDSSSAMHFKDFDEQDHLDAAAAHKKLGDEAVDNNKSDRADYHYLAAENHRNNAKEKKGVDQRKSLSPKQLKEHVENTSTEQLKKVAGNKDHPHNDAAKRELERRGGEDRDKHYAKLEELENQFASGSRMKAMLGLVEHLTGKKKFEDFDDKTQEKLFKVWDEMAEKNLSALSTFGKLAKTLGKTIGG